MLLAVGPEGPLAVYLAAGMVATVNPCGFAMLPAYLSYFLGDRDAPSSPAASVVLAVRVALAVAAGFLTVFAVAGLVVELTSLPVYENAPWVSVAVGLVLVALGIALLSGFELIVKLPKLERGGRQRTLASMFVFGLSYAVASIGCTLPTFLVAVSGTMRRQSVLDGVAVFAIYALGMAVVLVALTVALALARTSIVAFLRRSQAHVTRVSGALVVLAGLYVTYYGLEELRAYDDPGSVPDSGITNTVADWSYDVQDWVNTVGAVRIAGGLGAATVAALVAVARRSARRRDAGNHAVPADDSDQVAPATTQEPRP